MEKTYPVKIAKEDKVSPLEKKGVVAVTIIGGKQHLVHEGDVLTVENIGEAPGKKISGFNVLLFGKDGDFRFGEPYLKDAGIEAEVLENLKGRKIDVVKFKAKSRYSKKIGFRPMLSKIKILKISGGRDGA